MHPDAEPSAAPEATAGLVAPVVPLVPREQVEMTIPATAGYVRVARLVASGLAADLGFTLEELDELRVAVDELIHLLLARSGQPQVSLRYRLDEDAVRVEGLRVVEGAVEGAAEGTDGVVEKLVRDILAVTTDSWRLWEADGEVGFELAKRRRFEP